MTNPDAHRPVRRRRLRAAVLVLVVLAAVAAVVLVVRDTRGPGSTPAAAPTSASAAAATTSPPAPTAPASTAPPPAPPPAPATPTFDRAGQSIDDPNSTWVVVNKARPLAPIDHAPADLVTIAGGYQLRAEAARAMTDMLAAAAAEGLGITVQSAYRSYDYQVGLFGNQVARFGQTQAEVQVARPGFSEHQTGLAADVGGGGCDIESCFATTVEGQWVAANGPRFGYVVRYPDGRQDVTGFKYEPWHVRYVGVALATELQRTGVPTLEEFFGLPPAPGYTS